MIAKKKINILVISSLIIIISQIQFPNIEFNRIYPSCEKIFTIDGFPKDDDDGEKQFYKYVSCVLNKDKEFSKFLNKDKEFSNRRKLTKRLSKS